MWAPALLKDEISALLEKKDIPRFLIADDKKIKSIYNPEGEGSICAFFNIPGNRCDIYDIRSFECRLYPFLINLRGKKVMLAVDPHCPYVKENFESQEMKDYIKYLCAFFNSPAQIMLLKANPHIIQAYEAVLDIAELKIPDETE